MEFQVEGQPESTLGTMRDGQVGVTEPRAPLVKSRLVAMHNGILKCIDLPHIEIMDLADWRSIPVKILPKGTKVTLTV